MTRICVILIFLSACGYQQSEIYNVDAYTKIDLHVEKEDSRITNDAGVIDDALITNDTIVFSDVEIISDTYTTDQGEDDEIPNVKEYKYNDSVGLSTNVGRPCNDPLVLCVGPESKFKNITSAIESSVDGSIIQISKGTFNENIEVRNKSIEFVGGFNSDFSISSIDYKTIMSPTEGASFSFLGCSNIVVKGFVFKNGKGSRYNSSGGAIFSSESNVSITHNEFYNNDTTKNVLRDSDGNGGAFFGENSNVTFSFNIVKNNKSVRGAVAISGKYIVVEGNKIVNNISIGDHGGGLYISGSNLIINDNLIYGNLISPINGEGGWGAGVMIYDPHTYANLFGNVIVENTSEEGGSGIFVDDGANAVITENYIYNNVCPVRGGASAIYVDGLNTLTKSNVTISDSLILHNDCVYGGVIVEQSTLYIDNSVVWGNGLDPIRIVDDHSLITVTNSIIEYGYEGEGNNSTKPEWIL